MAWQQLVTPNPTVSAPPGWCLNHVQRAFGAHWSGSTATHGWELAQSKHTGTPPLGIAVPLWFAMTGEPAGHVVVWMPDGSIYSASDLDSAADYHPNLQHLRDFYGGRLTLRGWSEDLNGFKVVKQVQEEDMTIRNENHVVILYKQFLNATPTADDKRVWAGRTLEQFLNHFYPRRLDLPTLVAENKALKADIKPLNPGKYLVQ